MKKHKSPVKAASQDVKRHNRNVSIKHSIATSMKRAIASTSGGDKKQAALELKAAQKIVDSACSKGSLHRNTAARRVSKMAKKVAAMA